MKRCVLRCSFHSGSQGESSVTMHCLFQCNNELGPVVRKPINANPRLKLTEVFISLIKGVFES